MTPISCALCGRMVDDSETVDMPVGPVCDDPCYKWLEDMMEQATEIDDFDVDDYRETEDDS